jgi:hypothetical protein
MTEVPNGVPGGSKGIAFTNWLVNKAAGVLERKSSRRGFILGSAMVGSAVAVAGCAPGTQPGTPYKHITDCAGGLCTDGYTEFCCTINNGINACPPGSFVAGWWRADYSSFCNGTRYYMDCNQSCCGPSLGNGFCAGCAECRCAGGCDTRRVYCNYFRYGQCHQEIPVLGPIACRLVTCTPPYTVAEYACTTALAVDNGTAEHAPAHGCAPPVVRTTAYVLPATGAVAETATPGTVAVFGRRTDSSLALRRFNGSEWSTASLPTAYATSGIASTLFGNHLFVFHRGNDKGMWWTQGSTSWAPWQSLGGNFSSDPTAVTDPSGIYVFGRGADDSLWYNRLTFLGWSGFKSLVGNIDSDPVAVSSPAGVYVFVRGSNKGLWFRRLVSGSPGSWVSLGGSVTSDPAACATPTGAIVATRSAFDTVVVRYLQNGSAVGDWQVVGANATSDPTLCSGPSGTYLFVRGKDNGIWFSKYNGGTSWTALASIGGTARSSPIAVSDTNGVSVLYLGNDSGIWTRRWNGSSWGVIEQTIGGLYSPVRGRP